MENPNYNELLEAIENTIKYTDPGIEIDIQWLKELAEKGRNQKTKKLINIAKAKYPFVEKSENKKAIEIIYMALQGYCEDCISTDKKAKVDVDNAWNIIVKELENPLVK